jgi:protoheme IX farnesyltransferase
VNASRLRDYLTLTKPEVTFLVVAAAALGFRLAVPGRLSSTAFAAALVGTALVSGGTGALNMLWERKADARMRRTAQRPLPAGRVSPAAALAFGLVLAAAGGACLWLFTTPLASLLALGTLASYLLVYTPLKPRSRWCTVVGAIPGAAPPLIGWAAVRGQLDAEAWVLYAILFLWQFPHFLAIAWMYRHDYARAGMLMLPPADTTGTATFTQILGFTALLLPVSLVPVALGWAGPVYGVGAAALGGAFLASGVWAARDRSSARARVLLHASVAYLPLVYALLALDHRA